MPFIKVIGQCYEDYSGKNLTEQVRRSSHRKKPQTVLIDS